MDLSIIIPALNEGRKIAADIHAASTFLLNNHLTGEIIIIDDGSTDDTSQVAQNCAIAILPRICVKVISYENHRGKGYAVRTGICQSCGDFVAFVDSGSCVPFECILDGLIMIKNNFCDIAHGSRKLATSKIDRPQTFYRRICSAAFHLFLIYFVKIPAEFTDTQCGFKIYRGQIARQLYSQCVTDGFVFDIEVLLRAKKEGYQIREFPIEWSCDRDSRLTPARSSKQILAELRAICRAVS